MYYVSIEFEYEYLYLITIITNDLKLLSYFIMYFKNNICLCINSANENCILRNI